jgi:hypothetical protein
MSTLPLTKRNLDPHCRRFLTGNGAAWFKPTNQHATRPPSLRSTTFPIVRPYRKRLPQQPNNPSGRAHTESHQPNRG